jgi:hypothetical protein
VTLTLPVDDAPIAVREHLVATADLVGVAPAVLSCRLHEAVAAASPGELVVVELGDRATDPAVARILSCAAASAASRRIGFAVR